MGQKNSKSKNNLPIKAKNEQLFIPKTVFNCIVCLDIHIKLSQLSCCNSFICAVCLLENKNPKYMNCPNCKRKAEIFASKTAENIILESYSFCPICKFRS